MERPPESMDDSPGVALAKHLLHSYAAFARQAGDLETTAILVGCSAFIAGVVASRCIHEQLGPQDIANLSQQVAHSIAEAIQENVRHLRSQSDL